MSISNRIRATLGYLAVLCLAVAASAQTFAGAIVGRVVDSQQTAVAGASITLRSSERIFERHTFANTQGEYEFELVPPGRFSVRAEASGFAPTMAIVEVVVATPVRANLVLRVQPLKEEVKVLGESGVAVQTENANLGGVVSPREMTDLPSMDRSPYDFMALLPGATLSNDGAGVGFTVNGGRTQSANYVLDGAENNEILAPAPAQDVSLDSIQEFNIQTNHYSAEYGRNSGFIANIVTKSGTDAVHGSLYDYFRNSALAANTFDANAHGLPRPVFNRNQFGGTLGGPLRRAKLFYFAALETILVRSSGWSSFYVPTPQLLKISAPGTQAIFERFPLPTNLSYTNVLQERLCPFSTSCDAQTGVGYVTIPAFAFTSRLGPADFGGGSPQNTVLATGRLDWMIGPKTQAFLRYAIEEKDEFAAVGQPYSSKLDQPSYGDNQNVAINVIRTWSPTFATETRIAYDRVTGDPDRIAGNVYTVPSPPLPYFYILNENVSLPGGSPAGFGPLNCYQFFQTVTYSHGSHTLRFGGQFVYMRQNFTFGYAGQIADAQFPNTQGFVDGALNLYSIAVDPKGHSPGEFVDPPFGPPSFTRHYRYNEPALFIADTWKTARLTVTPGLRWEYFGVFHSPGQEHILDSNFYPGSGANFLDQIANGKMLPTIDAPGELQGRFYLPDYKNFAPRLGIAYDLFGDGKTVLRAGAGIFYDRRAGWELFRAYQNPPSYSFTYLTNVSVTPDLVQNQYAAFPNAPIQLTQSATTGPDIHMRTSYTASWNATFEKELAGTYVAGISYVGSSGSRLYSINNVNRVGSGGLLDPSCISTRIAADGITALGPDYSACPRLNSDLGDVNMRSNGGHSSYNALQLRLDASRLERIGLEFGGNYTWSHSIDNRSTSGFTNSVAETGGGYLDAFRPSLDRGSSDFDVRHRLAAHFIWELPFGNHSSSWAARYVASGWEVSGILSYQTGQPFTIADLSTPDATGERTRPRLTGPLPHQGALVPDSVSPNSYLYLPLNQVYDPVSGLCIANAAPFGCEISVNGPFDGTLPRNTFRQPGLFFQDMALFKNFPLPWRETQLQFRAEFYNVFNHPNLYVNGGSTDISTPSFTKSVGVSAVPSVTASFSDNREIVLALRVLF